MKKSVLTFGLLASSLVMLAIMPLFNNNNNSLSNTAMAQEYDKYGDSSYSQYPTDDNKYQCRTGPFEGFFVSSVEFCKHIKFDDKDRKDNNRDNSNQTGTQGPAGPAGPAGPQGIQGIQGPIGPAGINELNHSNLYIVEGNTVSINGTEKQATSSAVCDEGDKAIGGNYVQTAIVGVPPEASFIAVQQGISGDEDDSLLWAYTTSMINIGVLGGQFDFFVEAVCFDNPPPHTDL
jgi:hypothetical protein